MHGVICDAYKSKPFIFMTQTPAGWNLIACVISLLETIKTLEPCIKCWFTHTHCSYFYKVYRFPLWVLSHWKWLDGFLQIILTACYFSSRTSSYSSSSCSNEKKNMAELMGIRQPTHGNKFIPVKGALPVEKCLYILQYGLVTHAQFFHLHKPHGISVEMLHSYQSESVQQWNLFDILTCNL